MSDQKLMLPAHTYVDSSRLPNALQMTKKTAASWSCTSWYLLPTLRRAPVVLYCNRSCAGLSLERGTVYDTYE